MSDLFAARERALRRSAASARCGWTYISIDGRPFECGTIPSRHQPGWPDSDHTFQPRDTRAGNIALLLAELDDARQLLRAIDSPASEAPR